MVTPRIEASPDRSDFAKLGETIAASLVQEQEHANHASVLLEHTKQLADDIRSQVAASSSDPAFHTYASGLMAHEATPNDNRLKVRRPYPPVVPKFANPDEPSQVWAGRGKQPQWVIEKLASGLALEDLRIGRGSSVVEPEQRGRHDQR